MRPICLAFLTIVTCSEYADAQVFPRGYRRPIGGFYRPTTLQRAVNAAHIVNPYWGAGVVQINTPIGAVYPTSPGTNIYVNNLGGSSQGGASGFAEGRGTQPKAGHDPVFDRAKHEEMIRKQREAEHTAFIAGRLDRALHDVSTIDISTGQALNTLLESMQEGELPKEGIPVEAEVLARINVVKPGVSANPGMLKYAKSLPWTKALLNLPEDRSVTLRDGMSEGFAELVAEIAGGKPLNKPLLEKVETHSLDLEDMLIKHVADIAMDDYGDGKRFLKQFREGLTILKRPDAKEWVTGANRLRGASVQDIVKLMNAQKLKFAPAVGNDLPAYEALHKAFKECYEAGRNQSSISTK